MSVSCIIHIVTWELVNSLYEGASKWLIWYSVSMSINSLTINFAEYYYNNKTETQFGRFRYVEKFYMSAFNKSELNY